MRSPTAVLLALAAVLLASCATTGSGREALQEQTEYAVAQVAPSLVRIHVVEPDYYQGREVKFVASGSGAIITPEGHIVTNHHVAGKPVRLSVTLPNREEVPARLVGTDPATDIAVIQLMPDEPTVYPAVSFGDSDEIRAGDSVLALGSPRGISQSVTRGIVSNTAMVMPSLYRGLTFELDGENVGELVRWIAHDAEIHPGNSGGPLVNMRGEIVGVNEISFGLAGAIPGNLARKVAESLIENGEVSRAWTGLILQPRLRDSDHETGVLVSSVLEGTPAETAGLRSGDLLLSVGGTALDARFFEDLPLVNNTLADLPAGSDVAVAYMRGGETHSATLVPARREPASLPEQELRVWGMTARNLSTLTQLSLARDDKGGVLVTSTRPGGPAAKAKPAIERDDVIVRIGDTPVNSVGDLVAATKAVKPEEEGDSVPVLVAFERREESLLTVVEVGIEKLNDPDLEVGKGWLPMETQVLTGDLASHLGHEGMKGVRVTRVYKDSPEGFPFEAGDIVTHIDGEQIPASQPHDSEMFRQLVRQYRVGASAEFTVVRDDATLTVETELLASPAEAREMKRWRDLQFEFVVRKATWQDRQNPKLEGANVEVVADSVTEGGWAALGDLRVGDVILEVHGTTIESVADVEDAMKAVRDERPDYVIVKIRRGVQDAWLEMEPLWEPEKGPVH